jgi:hypothetical protein
MIRNLSLMGQHKSQILHRGTRAMSQYSKRCPADVKILVPGKNRNGQGIAFLYIK